ncbi:MAG: hypothetical protein ACRDPW_07280 [Mycobacteriales bacterium]
MTAEDGCNGLTVALTIPADEAWFWTPSWQARVAEAKADRAAGNSTVYRSDEEFLVSLT